MFVASDNLSLRGCVILRDLFQFLGYLPFFPQATISTFHSCVAAQNRQQVVRCTVNKCRVQPRTANKGSAKCGVPVLIDSVATPPLTVLTTHTMTMASLVTDFRIRRQYGNIRCNHLMYGRTVRGYTFLMRLYNLQCGKNVCST